MKKIRNLYEIIDDVNIKSDKIGEDPETGAVEWKISYEQKPVDKYEFKHSFKDLNDVVNNIIKINGQIKPTDPKLEELVMIIKNFRNRYARYLNAYQPDWKK
jgi:hypothetical protein